MAGLPPGLHPSLRLGLHLGLEQKEPVRVVRGAAHALRPRHHTARYAAWPLALQQSQRALLDPPLVLDQEERVGARGVP